MRSVSVVLLIVVFASLLLGSVSCTALALSGAKKYKVDLSNVMLKVRDQIESDGEVNERTTAKFESVLAKYEEEFGMKGSHIRATEALAEIKQAQANPVDAFMHYRNADVKISDVMDMLKTEVQ